MLDHDQREDTKRLGRLVDKIQFTMMTTISHEDGSLRSRPMTLQKTEFDGDFWFFASKSSPVAADIQQDGNMNLAFADPASSRYVSVVGHGEVMDSRQKAAELWNPALLAWFPRGLDDPELTLLKVHVTRADFWETPSSKVAHLIGFTKAMLTGRRPDLGGHHHVEGAPI